MGGPLLRHHLLTKQKLSQKFVKSNCGGDLSYFHGPSIVRGVTWDGGWGSVWETPLYDGYQGRNVRRNNSPISCSDVEHTLLHVSLFTRTNYSQTYYAIRKTRELVNPGTTHLSWVRVFVRYCGTHLEANGLQNMSDIQHTTPHRLWAGPSYLLFPYKCKL